MSGKGKLKNMEVLLIIGCLLLAALNVVFVEKIYDCITRAPLDGIIVVPEKSVGEDCEKEIPTVLVFNISTEDKIINKLRTLYPTVDINELITYQAYVNTYSNLLGFDSEFILSLIGVESKFNPTADSYLGARYGRGLMQVSEIALEEYNNWHSPEQWISIDMLYIPSINIKVGCWILAHNRDHYKVPPTGIDTCSAYNLGPTAWRNGNIAKGYSDKVLTRYEYLLRSSS